MSCPHAKTWPSSGPVGDGVTAHGASGLCDCYCWQCAGYLYPEMRFKNIQDHLRDCLPKSHYALPSGIMADRLAESGWEELAEEVRKLSLMSSR